MPSQAPQGHSSADCYPPACEASVSRLSNQRHNTATAVAPDSQGWRVKSHRASATFRPLQGNCPLQQVAAAHHVSTGAPTSSKRTLSSLPLRPQPHGLQGRQQISFKLPSAAVTSNTSSCCPGCQQGGVCRQAVNLGASYCDCSSTGYQGASCSAQSSMYSPEAAPMWAAHYVTTLMIFTCSVM